MKAKDIMTTSVVTVTPDTPVREIVALLLERRISALPVLDEGGLAGIVSEADFMRRAEIGTDGKAAAPWWARLFRTLPAPADYVRSHAGKARDIMTHEVFTVAEDAPLVEVAALLEKHRVKRLPVMRGERLAGIVSRADLVRALVAETRAAPRPSRDDTAIRERLLAELERQPWWRTPYASVTVSNGVVHFWGASEDDADRDAVRVAAENVPGVREVQDHRISLRDIPSMV